MRPRHDACRSRPCAARAGHRALGRRAAIRRTAADGCQDDGHRAARLARAPRRRGARARRSSRASSAPRPQLGRELRIPGFRKGKVPGADGDPADGARGGARAGRARLAARVVRGGDHALGRLDGRRPEARPGRPAAGAGEPLSFSIEVGGHAEGEARRLQGASRSAGASPRCRPRRSTRSSSGCASRFARVESVDRPLASRATSPWSTSSGASTASPSRAARRATTCSSSAAAGWSRASRSS